MSDQRGPFIQRLAASGGERLYRRHEDWWFECVRHEGEWWAVRQIGPSAYSWERLEDEHGFLSDQPLGNPPGEAVTAQEFDRAWAKLK
jgi:hypothetical protein